MSFGQSLLTVITPTYNAEKFIEKCVMSVQAQTFTDYTHIIIDGLSKDETVDLVRQYQKKFSNIRLISEKDNGIYDAMNKGIELSNSDWLYFLGADDFIYDKNVFSEVAIHLREQNTHLIYGDVYFEKLKKIYDGSFNIEKILKKNVCHQSIFYRSTVFKTVGQYNLYYRIVADYDLNLRCWLSGKINYSHCPLTIAYHSHGGVSSGDSDAAFYQDYPSIIISTVLTGNWGVFRKIYLLSVLYRKIIQRYSLRRVITEVFRRKFFFGRLVATLLMCASLPVYWLKRSTTNEK